MFGKNITKNAHKTSGSANAHTAFILVGILLVACLFITGCQSSSPPPSSTEQAAAAQAASAIKSQWDSGAHADTYVEKDGENATCTRCHAPVNYVPPASEIPQSCYVCKFEVKPPPPLTAKAEWKSVSCDVCHQVKNNVVDPRVKWLVSLAASEYQDISTSSLLCQKCHQVDVKAPHKPVAVAGSHADMTCTQCHDAHSTVATCSNAECHKDILVSSSIPGHDARHQVVACAACHDGSNLKVAPDPKNKDIWNTLSADGVAFTSHNLVREALCERCHFPANPWKLLEKVEKTVTR